MRVIFAKSSANICHCFFIARHSNGYVVVSHCVNLCFPNDWCYLAPFHVLFSHFFSKILFKLFVFLIEMFDIEYYDICIYMYISVIDQKYDLKVFSPSIGWSFHSVNGICWSSDLHFDHIQFINFFLLWIVLSVSYLRNLDT